MKSRDKKIFSGDKKNVFRNGFRETKKMFSGMVLGVLSLDYMIGKYGIIIIWQKINSVKIKGLRFLE